jgi:hypothetical protein
VSPTSAASVAKKKWDPSRVGSVRPSQLMYTYGVGALVDLPNFTVVIGGTHLWGYEDRLEPVGEDRLLAAVRSELGPQVTALRSAPWEPETRNPFDSWARTGVPVFPFPRWMRCPACKLLASIDSNLFELKVPATRPDKARYVHTRCSARKTPPAVVPARFVTACSRGHLDEFPWIEFVHRAGPCTGAPILSAEERGQGARSTDVQVTCRTCGATGWVGQAFGEGADKVLPACRGRNPHLRSFESGGCPQQARALLLGASNAWFPVTRSVLSIPISDEPLTQIVAELWGKLDDVTDGAVLTFAVKAVPDLRRLAGYDLDEVWAAIERRRSGDPEAVEEGQPDLRRPEWEVLRDPGNAPASQDFTLSAAAPPVGYEAAFAEVVQAHRLREVVALVGFTRLDQPDSGVESDVTDVVKAPLSARRPTWVPAAEVRGEGIFLRLPEDAVRAWEATVAGSDRMEDLREAHQRWRSRRGLDPAERWPGERYVLLHTLAHLLINELALECGYSAASIRERIYARDADNPDEAMAGVLLYTAAPDSEGTLGGLVALGEPDVLGRLLDQALRRAALCGSDPHCADHTPGEHEDVLHAAACHACLFVPETSCEWGNRYLDRAVAADVLGGYGLEYFKR